MENGTQPFRRAHLCAEEFATRIPRHAAHPVVVRQYRNAFCARSMCTRHIQVVARAACASFTCKFFARSAVPWRLLFHTMTLLSIEADASMAGTALDQARSITSGHARGAFGTSSQCRRARARAPARWRCRRPRHCQRSTLASVAPNARSAGPAIRSHSMTDLAEQNNVNARTQARAGERRRGGPTDRSSDPEASRPPSLRAPRRKWGGRPRGEGGDLTCST